MRKHLDEILTVPQDAQESLFAELCRATKRPSHNHLDELVDQLGWISDLALDAEVLADVPSSRIAGWAEEARRLTVTELREYTAPRRYALLVSLITLARASRLDDLVTMLIRFLGPLKLAPAPIWRRGTAIAGCRSLSWLESSEILGRRGATRRIRISSVLSAMCCSSAPAGSSAPPANAPCVMTCGHQRGMLNSRQTSALISALS